MFEFVTRRRLIFGLAALFFVGISLLFIVHVHSKFLGSDISSIYAISSLTNVTDNEEKPNLCYLTEPSDVVKYCHKCSPYERRAQAEGCSPTGYKEVLLCSKSNIRTIRSCPIPGHIQKQRFWTFEGIVLLIAVLSIASVQSRQKTLDKQMVEKIKRQIGESDK